MRGLLVAARERDPGRRASRRAPRSSARARAGIGARREAQDDLVDAAAAARPLAARSASGVKTTRRSPRRPELAPAGAETRKYSRRTPLADVAHRPAAGQPHVRRSRAGRGARRSSPPSTATAPRVGAASPLPARARRSVDGRPVARRRPAAGDQDRADRAASVDLRRRRPAAPAPPRPRPRRGRSARAPRPRPASAALGERDPQVVRVERGEARVAEPLAPVLACPPARSRCRSRSRSRARSRATSTQRRAGPAATSEARAASRPIATSEARRSRRAPPGGGPSETTRRWRARSRGRATRAISRLWVTISTACRLVGLLVEQLEDLHAGAEVELARRLVGEQDRVAGREGPGDRDALLLAARSSWGSARAARRGRPARASSRATPRARRAAADVGAELHVLERGQRREEVEASGR